MGATRSLLHLRNVSDDFKRYLTIPASLSISNITHCSLAANILTVTSFVVSRTIIAAIIRTVFVTLALPVEDITCKSFFYCLILKPVG